MPDFHFSEEFKARVRETIAPLSFKQLRPQSTNGQLRVTELYCLACGFKQRYMPGQDTAATAIHDCEWTHEFSWLTGKRCGGQIAFVTEPVLGAVSGVLNSNT